MLNQPKLKPGIRFEIVESEGVFLISERNSLLISDHLSQLIIPLINGQRTIDEIVDLMEEKASATEVYYTLMQMEQKGYIIESDNSLPSTFIVFCDHLNIAPSEAYERLQKTKVRVKTFGSISSREFSQLLESLNIQLSEEADIDIVITDDYLQEGLDDFNQKALADKRPWMLVKPVGTIIWLGPLFYPGRTGCWECLAQRLRNNRPVERFIQKHQNISTPLTPPLDSLPSTWKTALAMTATEIFKLIVQGQNKRLEGVLVTHDTLGLETQSHILVKRLQCPSCGEILNKFPNKPLPIILGSRKKTFTSDGGHRCCSPEETLHKYQHHISSLTGVVRELAKVSTASNSATHTYVAKHHFATIFDDLKNLRQNIRGRSAGKGKTDEQAKASAFCEAIERYSGVFQGNEIREKSSYQKMGEKAIHPNSCMNFSQAQYDNRKQWNAKCSGWFQKVPAPFNEEKQIDWTPVWSLTHQEFKYLPTAYCYYNYPTDSEPDCWADSNGCAAGNTIEEAILQGFMELVERDSIALWWYNQVKRPRVDLDSFDEPYLQNLQEYYRSIHRELWVLDITSDLNIPVFAAVSRRSDRQIEDIILGYGAHFDPKIAIQRALTEINQILPAVLLANADGSTRYSPSTEGLALDWWKNATLENQPYLVPDASLAPKVFSDYPQVWSDDLLEDVMNCKKIVEKNGIEMLVLDQTRPDIGLKVVKVIVPGMRHFWKRLAPGRLYDVPVKMGWLKEPLQEEQMNPFPMWM
ncbi:TOMM precursor leader peptide-binding protein [Aerosakkonema funiforme]|uniref:TOMM precursor leader peptide-binding protein n=1 Tax=Aerosakkonema funiforme TaxID=1246630 RepID=UPI0035B8C22C